MKQCRINNGVGGLLIYNKFKEKKKDVISGLIFLIKLIIIKVCVWWIEFNCCIFFMKRGPLLII